MTKKAGAPTYKLGDPVIDALYELRGPLEDHGVTWYEAHCLACVQWRRGNQDTAETWAYMHVSAHMGDRTQ